MMNFWNIEQIVDIYIFLCKSIKNNLKWFKIIINKPYQIISNLENPKLIITIIHSDKLSILLVNIKYNEVMYVIF